MAKRTPLPCTPENCGKAFSKCGSYSTYINSKCRCDSCRAAASESRKLHYAKNRDTILERGKQYRDANRDTILEQKKQYYRENRTQINEKHRAYRKANPEFIIELRRAYKAANRDKMAERARQWALANPERHRERVRRSDVRRRARMKQVQIIDFTPEQFEQRMAYYGHSCYLKLDCCTGAFDEIEHVKPISKLGPHMLANLRPACTPCNGRKYDHWPFAA